MGYRVRLGKLPKKQGDLLRQLNEADAYKYFEGRSDALYRPIEHTQLYEIGKNVSYVNEHIFDFYSFPLEEEEFKIVTKEGLIQIIQDYRKDIERYYEGVFDEILGFSNPRMYKGEPIVLDEEAQHKLIHLLFAKSQDWCSPYSRVLQFKEGLDGEMSGSWTMEYAIFNLMYILKTFDFENDYLIYSGW